MALITSKCACLKKQCSSNKSHYSLFAEYRIEAQQHATIDDIVIIGPTGER